MNIPKSELPRIVAIGCGFAGIKFVQKIDTRFYQVVLLDKNNYHTFQPLMYQVASAGLEPDSISYPIRKVFNGKQHFHFRMADVQHVDHDKNIVVTNQGKVHFDYLVVATGAATNFFGLKSVQQFSFTMKSLVESLNLRSFVLQNFEQAVASHDVEEQNALMNIVIVGGGATGVELAGAFAELKSTVLPKDYPDLDLSKMNIYLVEASSRVLSGMSEHASNKAKVFLERLGVEVILNTNVKDYDGTKVITNDENFQAKTLIWAAGVKGKPLENFDANLNRQNRIITDEFHKVESFENVYALGDVASIDNINNGKGHPMLASVASQQGAHLAKNFNALAKGKAAKPFKYNDKGTMATVGKNKAVVDLPKYKFSGIFAWFVWMFLHLMLLVDFRNRVVVFINWVWSYLTYDRGLRLIVRKVKAPEKKRSYELEEFS